MQKKLKLVKKQKPLILGKTMKTIRLGPKKVIPPFGPIRPGPGNF